MVKKNEQKPFLEEPKSVFFLSLRERLHHGRMQNLERPSKSVIESWTFKGVHISRSPPTSR